MPGRQTRKTASVAHLRASFESVDQGSPSRLGSIKPAEEHTPSPQKESNIHRRDWAVGDRASSRVSQHIIEKSSLGRLSQVTPSPLQRHFTGTGSNRPAGPQLTGEGYGITPSPMSDIRSIPQEIHDRKIADRNSSRGRTLKRVSTTEETTSRLSDGRSSVIHPSLIHPLLRQAQSTQSELHEQLPSQDAANIEGASGRTASREGFTPTLDHPRKVADLRQRYDRASASAPFLPFRRKDDHARPELATPTTSLVALSAAIGLATFQSGSKTPSPTDTPTSRPSHRRPSNPTPGSASTTDHPPSPNTKKHPTSSQLKDKITIFESLGRRPATLAKAKSAAAAATVRRRSGDVGAGLKTMAKNGSHMWRRLSGSLEKEEAEAADHHHRSPPGPNPNPSGPSSSSRGGAAAAAQKKKKQRVASRGSHGFEPRRNTHPSAPRESTFFVHGTISRVPRGVVSNRQQQLRASAAAGTTATTTARDEHAGAAPAPSLPDLDFEVDGAADMVGYFEQEFNISFSFTGSRGAERSGRRNTDRSAGANGSGSDRDGKAARYPSRNNHNPNTAATSKSRASPVLSTRSAHGSTTRPEIPPRNPARRRRIPASAEEAAASQQQRVSDPRRRPTTPAPARNAYGGFCDNRPVRPVPVPVSEGEREGEGDGQGNGDDVVVSSAQCGLAHPRPSRVLDVRRFVGYCRETARGRGVAKVGGKL
ncbi:hypothetical protein CONLIGDRAFT_410437 [Coniochaeta ligniaria NRRL 30616]|uniref:Uncharacterized protein n=1 Tax=Coniochaeta ligniaria NRRL 30616 TaxID=1408157 RepID=A0A1J7J7D2_9PEZI|nr:hypothetical protein CONLIGDRAFT_410437 [Coniochaeta ligniaria NRRL 30616]